MATFTWTNGTDGNWNIGTNWSGGVVPDSPTADVVIDAVPAAGVTAYTVTIAAGTTNTVSTLSINPINNVNGPNNPGTYIGAQLEIDGTLIFAPGSAGTLDGPLQNYITMNGGTIVNGGTLNGFIQTFNDDLITGTNGLYVTNWLQSFGTTTIDTASIAEMTGTVLFDGIFEAKGPGATVNLGGPLQNLTVNIVKVEGPPIHPTDPFIGWTELLLDAGGSAINEWNGTTYVPIEQTLATISTRGTVDVTQGRDYTTGNVLTIENGGLFNLQAGTVSTGGFAIQSGGIIKGAAFSPTEIANDGTIISGGAGFVLTGAVSGGGTITFLDNASTIEVGSVGASESVVMLGGDTLKLDTPAAFAAGITAQVGDKFFLNGITADSATLTGGTLSVMNGAQTVATLRLVGDYSADHFVVTGAGGAAQIDVAAGPPVCYARGTRILTEHGEVPIEALDIGQRIVTASGATAPIKWIGRRRVDCKRHPAPHQTWPVRIAAGAFGDGLPRRDLMVSPQHGMFLFGVLIPAKYLINGLNVAQIPVATVEYFHIELANHDLLIAEGVAAESYLENGDRGMFENNDGPITLHPSFNVWRWEALGCADLKVAGPEVEAARMMLLAAADTEIVHDIQVSRTFTQGHPDRRGTIPPA